MGLLTWQEVAAILIAAFVVGGGITYTDLLGSLFQLKGIEYTHSGDVQCGDLCESYVNVTTSYWRVCFGHYNNTSYENEILFKKVSRSRTLHVNMDQVQNIITTNPTIIVEWLVPTYGGHWRPLQHMDCWERGKVNRIKIIGHKEPEETVKWGFNVDEYVDIDPIWESNITKSNYTITDTCEEVTKVIEIEEYVYRNDTVCEDEYVIVDCKTPEALDNGTVCYLNDTRCWDIVVGTPTMIKKNVTKCIESTLKYVYKNVTLDYGKNKIVCTVYDKYIECDEDRRDGNGDGICQSGETCYKFKLGADDIDLVSINNGDINITGFYPTSKFVTTTEQIK